MNENNMPDRDELIEYAVLHMSDMIPHNDPNYWSALKSLAEQYADWVLEDPVRAGVCGPANVEDDEIVMDETPW
jgi:hypothetical protein